MTTKELNTYILNYLRYDRTQTAIMLTGEWGSGKTYYVENELCPFLKENSSTVVVVSLYGVKDVAEISKSIYMELRMPKLGGKHPELFAAGKVIARNVLKYITGSVGINLELNDQALKELFESVNLKDALLVFEDVERCKISISSLLGYVNGLVERDGVKVLLVANENEILRQEDCKINADDLNRAGENTNVSDEIKTYLRIKEKTISDTIHFNGNIEQAVTEIVKSFDNDKLNLIFDRNEDILKSVSDTVAVLCRKNLRTFIFAVQKTVGILNMTPTDAFDDDFYKCLLLGNIHLSSRIKANAFPAWEGNEFLSTRLGTNDIPVMRFSYDYIRWQTLNIFAIKKTYEAFKEFRFFERNPEYKDADLRVLSSYPVETEANILVALNNIEKKLQEPNAIGIHAYCKLAYYLIYVGSLVGFDYNRSCELMLLNAKGLGNKTDIEGDSLFVQTYDIKDSKIRKIYIDYIRKLMEAFSYTEEQNEFSYRPSDIGALYRDVCSNTSNYIVGHRFLSRYNTDKIIDMLAESTSGQIYDFRGVLLAIYRKAGHDDFDEKDIEILKELLSKVNDKYRGENKWDSIQMLQIEWLINNLEEFIKQLS